MTQIGNVSLLFIPSNAEIFFFSMLVLSLVYNVFHFLTWEKKYKEDIDMALKTRVSDILGNSASIDHKIKEYQRLKKEIDNLKKQMK